MANKTDLVNYVAANVEDMTKKKAAEVVDAVLEGITAVLNSGDKVQLIGFGSFEVRERAPRKGQNPKLLKELKEQGVPLEEAKQKAQIDIPASKTVGFSAGKTLKEFVNK